MSVKTVILFCMLALPLFSTPGFGKGNTNDYESHQHIIAAAKKYLKNHIVHSSKEKLDIDIDNMDSRLKLPKCEEPLDISHPTDDTTLNNVSLSVSCPTQQSWRIYLQAEIKILSDVVVPNRTLPRNSKIRAGDLTIKKVDRVLLRHGYFQHPSQLVNKITKYTIRAGRAINPRLVRNEYLVRRGELVRIIAKHGSLHVEMQGIAKENGGINESIVVINASSKRRVEATVTGPGKVQVAM